MKTIFPILILLLAFYLLVLMSVIADLWSGIRKAKERGDARTSAALRRTIDKLARYYNALFAITVIDAMQLMAIMYLRVCEGFDSILAFPVLTLLGALGIAAIELKSIYEKADEKQQKEYRDAAELLQRLLTNNLKKINHETFQH